MKIKILGVMWWLSLVVLGGAMDADPISWAAVAATFTAFIAISVALIKEQRESASR